MTTRACQLYVCIIIVCVLPGSQSKNINRLSNDSHSAHKIKIYLLSKRYRTCIVPKSKKNLSGVSTEKVSFICWQINMLHDIPATQVRTS